MDTNYLSAEEVRSFISRVFCGLGMPEKDAALCADLMVRTDLSGADGHGVFRLLQYARRIQAGGINLHPQMKLLKDAPSIGLLHVQSLPSKKQNNQELDGWAAAMETTLEQVQLMQT